MMKTIVCSFFALLCVCAAPLWAQEYNTTVLFSDTCEDDAGWPGNFDAVTTDVLDLNNAMGGDQTLYWSGAWGGATINAVSGAQEDNSTTKCIQLHWGGVLVLDDFVIDPAKTYQLECMVYPGAGNDGTWNNWAGVHLFIADSANLWQDRGVRVLLRTTDQAGGNPNTCAVEYWSGGYQAVEIMNFNADPGAIYVDGVNATDQWIPLKLIFTGAGTVASPFTMDVYLNGTKQGPTINVDSLDDTGAGMLGLSSNAAGGPALYDNFKLSELVQVPVELSSFDLN